MSVASNPYLPARARVVSIVDECAGPRPIKTFEVELEPSNGAPAPGLDLSLIHI